MSETIKQSGGANGQDGKASQIPSWQFKCQDEMTDEERALWDAWEPTEDEALAVSRESIRQLFADEEGVR